MAKIPESESAAGKTPLNQTLRLAGHCRVCLPTVESVPKTLKGLIILERKIK